MKLKLACTIATFFTIALLTSQAALAGYAGMLLVAEKGGEDFVLLVRDRSRTHFELPAGKIEKGDQLNDGEFILESSYETALRETVEETRGYLGRRLLTQSSSAEAFIRLGEFEMFVAKVPMFDLDQITSIRIPKGAPLRNTWYPMREIVAYRWVAISELAAADKNNQVRDMSGESIAVHYLLAEEVRLASDKGWFAAAKP